MSRKIFPADNETANQAFDKGFTFKPQVFGNPALNLNAYSNFYFFSNNEHLFYPIMKRIRVLLLAMLAIGFAQVYAQEYDLAIGLRAGSANGLTLKRFISHSVALEGMVLYRQGGARATGLIEAHFPITDGFYLLLGGGGHMGYTSSLFAETRYNRLAAGVDIIAGGEYVFPRSPVAISFDIMPGLELVSGARISGNNAGVTLKYLFN